ncbi:PREDICTED: odorant receptor 22c-like [Acromyrmex echinatior]|uniref:odorant receptor 22c-like n=1 Tax=Acromyrmex echinatior TaxID=103372 RepID=UPI000580F481|nr:PREDICTED: odorant receptor 22c-like [Acromyrmex echinatior]
MLRSTVSPLLKMGLSLIGIWPGASYGTLCWFFYMTTLVVMQYFQYSYVYEHFDFNNLTKLMDGLGLTLDYTLTILKLISFWFNRRIFADILIAMDDDWKDNRTNLRECVMMNKANLAHRCSNAMISVNALATFLYFIESHVRGYTRSKNGQFRRFPIQVQFPFEVYKTPVYELVGVGLFFHVLKTAIIIAILNALILTLVLHVSGQIDIMCQELKAIPSMIKSSSVSTKSLVVRHQKIISLSKNIESFFSFVALLQFVWNTFVICAIGFMVVISLGMNMTSKFEILVQFIIPYFAVTIEAFVFCFAGEYLSTKSKAIGDAAYETVWYELSTSECRILLFVILRSQKQLTITAGKVMNLTLEGFTNSKSISDAAYETLWYDLSTSECRILLLIIVRSQKRLTITAGKIMDLTLEGFTSVMKASASYMSVLHVMY